MIFWLFDDFRQLFDQLTNNITSTSINLIILDHNLGCTSWWVRWYTRVELEVNSAAIWKANLLLSELTLRLVRALIKSRGYRFSGWLEKSRQNHYYNHHHLTPLYSTTIWVTLVDESVNELVLSIEISVHHHCYQPHACQLVQLRFHHYYQPQLLLS